MMELDIITKDILLELLEEGGIDKVVIQEVEEGLTNLEKYEGIPQLGYAFDRVQCQTCGNIHTCIHSIPMRFPCECNVCGQRSCFVITK